MSYCRFMSQETADRYNQDDIYSSLGHVWEPSDLYIFEHVAGFMQCCGCRLNDGRYFDTTDLDAMIAHLVEHEAAGHVVPNGLVQDLIEGWPKEWLK